ncbi:MAG: tRNA pseudouridine(38-40) synthase TruA [Clostridia bacterium]|nr:tRNA pseudouridine(38-40) synthase TruA [Clostridia bacterium]
MKYFAIIKYLGCDFHGFQVQPNARTVQGELTAAFSALFATPVMITGCSRTDSGVHANEFAITVEAQGATVPPEKLPIAVMRYLPKDVAVVSCTECMEGFHPRYSIKSKEYLYRIKNSRIRDPFDVGRVWFFAPEITDEGLARMHSAAKYIVGKQDFASFMAEGSDVADTVRTVEYLTVDRRGDYVEMRVCADGFLYNMVRIIVGTLIDVALGRITSEDVGRIIESKNRAEAGMTAPPDGLYLNKVNY